MNTGQVVKEIIKEKGVTQTWLAKQLNMSTSTLNAALKNDIQFLSLCQICEILNISIVSIYEKVKKDAVQPAKTARHLNSTKLHK